MNSLRSRERAQASGAVEVFSKLEGEIREVFSRSATAPRVSQQNDNELAASHIGSLLQRVSGTSVQEIEKLIGVQREIVGYAALIQNARRSISTISDSLSFWQRDRDDPPRISA
jgi:hypothetical protein